MVACDKCVVLFQGEAVVYDAFSSEEFVDKLVGFLSLEERKGKDKYDWTRSIMFKVRRNFYVSGNSTENSRNLQSRPAY